jgi:hypothetical protein
MTDKPMIFSAPMIRALLDGRKHQTRRVLKPQPVFYAPGFHVPGLGGGKFPYKWLSKNQGPTVYGVDPKDLSRRIERHLLYAPGDRLWAREAHAFGWPVSQGETMPRAEGPDHAVTYRADGDTPFGGIRWRPSIHMPRWASRLTLTVTDVRVQRSQEINEADAEAEGVTLSPEWPEGYGTHALSLSLLWNDIHGSDAWDRNDWVVALTFDVHRCNIDAMPK